LLLLRLLTQLDRLSNLGNAAGHSHRASAPMAA
jgi:hypothetical protein